MRAALIEEDTLSSLSFPKKRYSRDAVLREKHNLKYPEAWVMKEYRDSYKLVLRESVFRKAYLKPMNFRR